MAERELHLRSLWTALLRNTGMLSLFVAGAIATAAVITRLQDPTFQSETTIVVRESAETMTSPSASPMSLLAGMPNSRTRLSLTILQSRQLTEAVADSLSLHVRLTEPRVARAEILRSVWASRMARPQVLQLEHVDGLRFRASVSSAGLGPSAPREVIVGVPAQIGEVLFEIDPRVAENPPRRIRMEVVPFQSATAAVRKRYSVEQLDPTSQIFTIRFRSPDSLLAAAIPAVVTHRFAHALVDKSRSEFGHAVHFLRDQVAHYEVQLEAAEDSLRAFRERASVYSPADQATEHVQRFAELRGHEDALQREHTSLGLLLSELRNHAPNVGAPSPYRQLAAYPTFLSNPAVQGILESLIELDQKRLDLIARRTDANIDVRTVNQQIQELEQQLLNTGVSYHRTIGTQINVLQPTLARMDAEIGTIPAREVQFARLLRQQKVLEEVYALLQARLKESEIKVEMDAQNIHVIDPPLVPISPVSPRPLVNLLLGGLIGLIMAVGFVLIRESGRRPVRSRADVLALAPGISILGTIPGSRSSGLGSSRSRFGKLRLFPQNGRASRNGHGASTSAASGSRAIAYRSVRTRLTSLRENGSESQTLVFTAPVATASTSSNAAHLAMSLAEQRVSVLLIDADPGSVQPVHEILAAYGAIPKPGLSDLTDGRPIRNLVQALPMEGVDSLSLDLIAIGSVPQRITRMIESGELERQTAPLRARYQVILINAPAVEAGPDAAVLGRWSDGTAVVLDQDVTDSSTAGLALDQLRQLNVPVVGVILNAAS